MLPAIIGKKWATESDSAGVRRLEDPNDFVRLEIEAALARDIRIIPVLVAGAEMPDPAGLPPSLGPMTRRQALDLSSGRFDTDAEGVVAAVVNALAELRSAPARAATERPANSRSARNPTSVNRSATVIRRLGVAASIVFIVGAATAIALGLGPGRSNGGVARP